MLITAKTQHWSPEEFLRTLIDAEIVARDKPNTTNRMTAAKFPVRKNTRRVQHRRVINPATHPRLFGHTRLYPSNNEPGLIGPAGTGKSHYWIALGHAAVTAG